MSEVLLPVVLQRADCYGLELLLEKIDKAMQHSGITMQFHGKMVLLKPNLISGHGHFYSCTHPQIVGAAARWFRDHGAKVVVGDSPAFGSAKAVAGRRGLAGILDSLGIPLLEFVTPTTRHLASGIGVTVAAEALACDLFVGLPKIKAHQQLYTTMAVKNIFGIVKGTRKAMLHMRQGASPRLFAGLIIDLIALLPQQLHIADGIEVMHKTGPLHGESLQLGCLAASTSAVGLDTAMLAALELPFGRSPLWQEAVSRKMTGTSLDHLSFPELPPEDWCGSGFLGPDQLSPIRFRPQRFLVSMLRRVSLALARK
jgi:uncharacterized protein (DUF362 family)